MGFVGRPCLLLEVLPGDRVTTPRGYPPEDGRPVLGQLRAVFAREELRPPRACSSGELLQNRYSRQTHGKANRRECVLEEGCGSGVGGVVVCSLGFRFG